MVQLYRKDGKKMLRPRSVVSFMGLLLVLGPTARAQESDCPQAPAKVCCPAPVTKSHECTTSREKPYAEATPPKVVRTIAPRNLPPAPTVDLEEARRSQKAARIVNRTDSDLIRNAKHIAVIPGVKKAAFVSGGRWGKGLLTRRGDDGRWIPP